jgi:hypothetical protein
MNMEYMFYYFPLIFIIFWILACLLLSKVGGWYKMSQKNPISPPDSKELAKFDFQSLKLGNYADYNSCINVNIFDDGILINVLPIFKIMHPPLFIKFSEFENVQFDHSLGVRTLNCYVRGRKIKLMGASVQAIEKKCRNLILAGR